MSEKDEKSDKKEPVVKNIPGSFGDVEIIDPSDPKWFEIVDYKDEKAKFYPYTGAYISVATGKIMGNKGGKRDWDGSAMGSLGQQQKREAVLNAFTTVAIERGFGVIPAAALSKVVQRRLEVALDNEGRAGNDAAKFVVGLIGFAEDSRGETGPAMRIDLDKTAAKELLMAIVNWGHDEEEPSGTFTVVDSDKPKVDN